MGTQDGAAENGTGNGKYTLTLTFDPATFTLLIGGRMMNYDQGISVCEMAARSLKEKKAAAQFANAIEVPGGKLPLTFGGRH